MLFLDYSKISVLLVLISSTADALQCYFCTNYYSQNQSNALYREGCEDPVSNHHLMTECAIIPGPGNNQTPTAEDSFSQLILGEDFQMTDTFSNNNLPNENVEFEREGSVSLVSSRSLIDWVCVKGTAVFDGTEYVARGCVWAYTSDTKDRCENINNQYLIVNVTLSKGEMCFCKGDGCNSAPRNLSSTWGLPGLYFILVFYLFK